MSTIDLFKVDEISISYSPRKTQGVRPQVNSSMDAYVIFKENWSNDIALREEFNILLLDNQCRVLGMSNLSKGGITSTLVDIRLAFATAIKSRASCMILAHNHPSNCLRPSLADIALTRKFLYAGKILDINIWDHIILTPDSGYFSFADEDLITVE